MTRERWQKIEKLFHAASDLPESQRMAYLERSCGGDLDLLREVQELVSQNSIAQPLSEAETGTIAANPAQLGVYRLDSRLGAGGMGEVFRAIDTRLSRPVAVKVSREEFTDRFRREALALSALNHPHICSLYDVGPNYIVMELVEGDTLAALICQGPLPFADVLRYSLQIGGALQEAHRLGIVHRDLKPGNIMITRHGAKVLDFGLAKMSSDGDVTEAGVVMGTPLYMAPEQLECQEADARTDLFSLGLVLYEMSTGSLPVPGKSLARLLLSRGQKVTAPSTKRGDIPASFDAVVARLLERDQARRYRSADELIEDLQAIETDLDHPAAPSRRLPWAIAALAVLAAIVAGTLFYRRIEHQRWAREEAIPQIARLKEEDKAIAAYRVLRQAQQYLPGDAQVAQIEQNLVLPVVLRTKPPGASIEIQDYLSPGEDWLALGSASGKAVPVPNGYFRWRVTLPGFEPLLVAPSTEATMEFVLQPIGHATQSVSIPGGAWGGMIDFIGWLQYRLPAYEMDRLEVTNAEYQKFVDQGGYRRREFWKQPFVGNGLPLSWEQAMDLFRDPTGRPGPSTWEAGHYPEGKADFPVSGVSWYEAAAYAEYAGRSLPAVAQWFRAAPVDLSIYSTRLSNFNGKGPVKAGTLPNVGPDGTYDMSGNVREWCLNEVDGDQRFILGGAWGTQPYQAYCPEALPPLDRSAMNGIRTVRNLEPLPPDVGGPIATQVRDFSKTSPVSDQIFNIFRTTTYAYDRRPLNSAPEIRAAETTDWIQWQTSIDAGYSNERLTVNLFIPKNVKPPFQTVVFVPSARVMFRTNSKDLGDMGFIDYAIKSGRAVIYPIYRGTYERTRKGQALPGQINDLEVVVDVSKEVRRSVDYLETQPARFALDKIAYLGVSQGAAFGVIYGALDDRFRTFLFLDGGYLLGRALPARDQVNFVPRIKKPVLMVNGQYDFTFSVEHAQNPMFEMLGTPAADKRHVIFDTPHDISQKPDALAREVLGWLDKYLGKIE
jgi:serine/threonine protein kinase/formylglycine-generating enzyme required for sulfatase activity